MMASLITSLIVSVLAPVFVLALLLVKGRRQSVVAQRERWKQIKSKGKMNFVLRVGVLQGGGLMFAAMTLSNLIDNPHPRRPIDYVFEILFGMVWWLLAGYSFGLIMWEWFNKRFSEPPSSDTCA